MQCTVAVSGGSDSLFALLSLKEAGYEVHALHARFLPRPGYAEPALARLCASLGISFEAMDLVEPFRRCVMDPFAQAHVAARTPNPCALCNRDMKFGLLLNHALNEGGLYATGHYASMQEHPAYGLTLRAANYVPKDQSYFLALVPIERLRRCIFPLAGVSKPDARAWLKEHCIPVPLPSESQEICFINNNDHCAWLEERRKEGLPLPGPGPVELAGEGRIIATHKGLWRYTEGQRRGLGIPWRHPLYVLERRQEDNTLVVGPQNLLCATSCAAGELNIMVPYALWPETLFARVRYRHTPLPADVELEGCHMTIRFHEPQDPPAPGQVAAI